MTDGSQNGWATAAWIVALLQAAFLGAVLIYLATDSYTREFGWDGWIINPWSMIDVAILLTGVIGILMKRAGFALMLAIHAGVSVLIGAGLQSDQALGRILFGLIFILVYFKAYQQLKPSDPSGNSSREGEMETDSPPSNDERRRLPF